MLVYYIYLARGSKYSFTSLFLEIAFRLTDETPDNYFKINLNGFILIFILRTGTFN